MHPLSLSEKKDCTANALSAIAGARDYFSFECFSFMLALLNALWPRHLSNYEIQFGASLHNSRMHSVSKYDDMCSTDHRLQFCFFRLCECDWRTADGEAIQQHSLEISESA